MACKQRLLKDVHETQAKPYPNIHFIWHEGSRGKINKACLILTPDNTKRIHLTVQIPSEFPLMPPNIRCDSKVHHPNVFNSYICASILNTTEGWTPAYTLKGVAIQILSFFSSENLEQEHGNPTINIRDYAKTVKHSYGWVLITEPDIDYFSCAKCGFEKPHEGDTTQYPASTAWGTAISRFTAIDDQLIAVSDSAESSTVFQRSISETSTKNISDMPDELLAHICKHLEEEDLVKFAKSWDKIGGAKGVVTKFNILRNRELLCFTLKKTFDEAKLGIGISIQMNGRKGMFESEFELISLEAFKDLSIGRSVQGIAFTHWLPVPLSARHYAHVKPEIMSRLDALNNDARLEAGSRADTIYHFMNDVIVKLSQAEDLPQSQKSTLRHASEKAIESYYHLFHILLCLAAEDKSIVDHANKKLRDFQGSKTSKTDCPNLGHLLLAILVSDVELTEKAMKTIIREAITRNVVWMFDQRGAGMMDLAHMEKDEVCEYRLTKTYEASKTSYRLLMFFNLFRNSIQRGTGEQRRSLEQMRNELFDAHGAPPFGIAAQLAAQVKAAQGINDFFAFLEVMGIEQAPSRAVMTSLLRACVWDSVSKGYHRWAVTVGDAKAFRLNGGDARGRRVSSFFPNARR